MPRTKQWTPEADARLQDYLENHDLHAGKGTRNTACSIQAINIALSGRVSDKIPPCMSKVTGGWIIAVQDSIPDEMRNSAQWKELLPTAAATKDDMERERTSIVIDWMWEKVLPQLPDIPLDEDFKKAWKRMLEERTENATALAAQAAMKAHRLDRGPYLHQAATHANSAILCQERRNARNSEAGQWTARAADMMSAAFGNRYEFWEKADPIRTLKSLTQLSWTET